MDSALALKERCPKPGCGALKRGPCTDWDCPQQWLRHEKHAAEVESLQQQLTAANTRIGDLEEGLRPFAFAARCMFFSGHCGGASPEDWPAQWLVHLNAGPDLVSPQAWPEKMLMVQHFYTANALLSPSGSQSC